MKKLILASTSTLYGQSYLQYLFPTLNSHFKSVETIIFIPFARPGGLSHEEYTQRAQSAFDALDIEVKGIHQFSDARVALKSAQAIFTGGGNTFVLVSELYKRKLMAPLREVIFKGIPYLGTSAGSNICGLSMQTTNDMPIMYPPSFKALGIVPFNINPHYLDPQAGDEHMGETRETRIKEYHKYNNPPVLGLREGSWLNVTDDKIVLEGTYDARVFEKAKKPYELSAGATIDL